MKKVGFMKLSLQEENFLSKEERKEVLGGVSGCYLMCRGSSDRHPVSDCDHLDPVYYCNGGDIACCSCLGGCN